MKTQKTQIYTTPDCVFCHALMDWLEDEGIDFEEHDISNPVERAKAEKALGGTIQSVPVTLIDGERIDGFKRPAIKRALKKLK